MVVLDTSVAIRLRDGDSEILDRLQGLHDTLALSVVTRVELEGGIVADPARAALRRPLLDAMIAGLVTLPFDEDSVLAYRTVVETAGYSRRKVIDRMIAAQALARSAALVTLNGPDFRDIRGLRLIEW